MRTSKNSPLQREREFKSEDMVWTRIYYGREVMERILDTIDVKRALHQRFFIRYTLRAAMAGVIICLMYIFAYGIKTDLGRDFNPALAKYLMSLNFSMALAFIYFTNSELLTSNFMYFTVGRYIHSPSQKSKLLSLARQSESRSNTDERAIRIALRADPPKIA
jgi:formate/nitrite transporter FocA (FNT family)